MKKILLLNPPGRALYIRDYYCSKVSQAEYITPPLDLLIMSGGLHSHYQVDFIDAIVENLGREAVRAKVSGQNYAAVIMLVGSVSWAEDRDTIRLLKQCGVPIIIATGDILLENGQERLREVPELDAALLDFTGNDILHYLSGDFGQVRNMIYRSDGEISTAPGGRERQQPFTIPVPRHELFANKGYRHPFAQRRPISAILTDFGCPFRCSFCIMATLGFKYRTVDNVLEELRYIQSLGIKELFWVDQTFGARKDRSREICQRMIAENIKLGWFTFTRVDVVDYEMLKLMKAAGCHTVIFGVESANEDILRTYQKGYNRQQIKQAFKWCDELKLNTVGTFILGLPEETEATCLETIRFAKEIHCDFASFNVAVPRIGTDLRAKALDSQLIGQECITMDQSGTQATMPTQHLTLAQVQKLKSRAVREFYLRPSYLFRRIRKIRSWYQLKVQIANGWSLIRNFK